jgi:excisionase family DNA binding protein
MHPKGARRSPSLQARLRTAEVADLPHVHPKTVARWAKQGLLPHGRTLGGHRRFPEAAIRELTAGLHQEVQADGGTV